MAAAPPLKKLKQSTLVFGIVDAPTKAKSSQGKYKKNLYIYNL